MHTCYVYTILLLAEVSSSMPPPPPPLLLPSRLAPGFGTKGPVEPSNDSPLPGRQVSPFQRLHSKWLKRWACRDEGHVKRGFPEEHGATRVKGSHRIHLRRGADVTMEALLRTGHTSQKVACLDPRDRFPKILRSGQGEAAARVTDRKPGDRGARTLRKPDHPGAAGAPGSRRSRSPNPEAVRTEPHRQAGEDGGVRDPVKGETACEGSEDRAGGLPLVS